MTFPSDYQCKTGLWMEMMFHVETRNRNQQVHKFDLWLNAKIKDYIWNAKMTNDKCMERRGDDGRKLSISNFEQ